jgi:sterol desaturase/sphingolipid hydroxylase (fatty acid hydroxylase superfamily)
MTRAILQRAIYPFTMGISTLIFFLLIDADSKLLLATTAPFLFSIAVILIFEKQLAFRKEWKPSLADLKIDSFYLIVIQTLLPKVLVWIGVLFMAHFLAAHELTFSQLWPHHWSIGTQGILLIFVSDFLRYWLHRLSHTIPFLWRFHAVHHSVDKLYWMNTSRFHPVEKSLQFCFDVFPFMLLAVSPEVIGLHLVLYGVNGFFQHCNIDLKYGWLNYIVSSTEHHRWHHSKNPKESNNNYGNNIILWDILFKSFYHPNKTVDKLGLINKQYPQSFGPQFKAPFIDHFDKQDLPLLSYKDILLNLLLKVKMNSIKKSVYKTFYKKTHHCKETQIQVMLDIISENKNTEFGKDHSFEKIKTYEDFKQYIPVQDYESLRPYIYRQEENQDIKGIISKPIVMFNKTSGTTAAPKLLPLTEDALANFKTNQQVSSYIQYRAQPLAYSGKIVGIVSPAIETKSEHGIPVGSASGHFYKTMPYAVKSKYLIPHTVFEISDYELKYYCILLLSLQDKNITYIGSANPTTFLKLIEILNERKKDLLHDLKTKTVNNQVIDHKLQKVVDRLNPSKKRLIEIEQLFASEESLTFTKLWPYIKMVTVWTGGSCGIALSSLVKLLPKKAVVYDPGYLSSEMRGSITFDLKNQSGLMTFENNFYEFIERNDFEANQKNFLQLHELEVNKEYYLFVTTSAGLYRYDMNDIVLVVGFENQCPLIKFVQKGRGVCSITGEKLYESQIIHSLNKLDLNFVFVQFIANESAYIYECFIELDGIMDASKTEATAARLDTLLCEQNMEYKEKRGSNRLKHVEIKLLKRGTYSALKEIAITKGQNESQFKIMLLQYKKDLITNLEQFLQHD